MKECELMKTSRSSVPIGRAKTTCKLLSCTADDEQHNRYFITLYLRTAGPIKRSKRLFLSKETR